MWVEISGKLRFALYRLLQEHTRVSSLHDCFNVLDTEMLLCVFSINFKTRKAQGFIEVQIPRACSLSYSHVISSVLYVCIVGTSLYMIFMEV